MYKKFVMVFLLALLPSSIISVCPKDVNLYPCKCINNTEILCDSHDNYNLKQIFVNIKSEVANREPLYMVRIENYGHSNIPEDVFNGIEVLNIEIADSNVTSIDENAFVDTSLKTESFALRHTLVDNKGPKEKDIFLSVSKMKNLKYLYLVDNRITTIPEHAFKKVIGTQKDLTLVSLTDNGIEDIGDNAFFDLISLTKLYLYNNKINKITSQTLAFETFSNNTLEVNLENNQLDSGSFDPEWYTRTRRPLQLNLNNNKMTHLPEHIFSAFLNRERQNMIKLEQNEIFCDCKSKWLVEDVEYYKNKVQEMICQDKRNIFEWQISEFNKC